MMQPRLAFFRSALLALLAGCAGSNAASTVPPPGMPLSRLPSSGIFYGIGQSGFISIMTPEGLTEHHFEKTFCQVNKSAGCPLFSLGDRSAKVSLDKTQAWSKGSFTAESSANTKLGTFHVPSHHFDDKQCDAHRSRRSGQHAVRLDRSPDRNVEIQAVRGHRTLQSYDDAEAGCDQGAVQPERRRVDHLSFRVQRGAQSVRDHQRCVRWLEVRLLTSTPPENTGRWRRTPLPATSVNRSPSKVWAPS